MKKWLIIAVSLAIAIVLFMYTKGEAKADRNDTRLHDWGYGFIQFSYEISYIHECHRNRYICV